MTFELTPAQEAKYEKWRTHHRCIKYFKQNRHFTFTFIPTGMGNIARVTCSCGKEIDLTDSEDW